MIVLKDDGSYEMSDVEKKAIIEEMEGQYKTSLNETRDVRRRWWLVERYLEGQQWSSSGESGWTFLSIANDALLSNNLPGVNVDENVVVDNLMLRIHMTNMARLIRYKPQIEIAPNDKSRENNVAIRKGRIALYDLLYKSNWIRLQQSYARHLNAYGVTFLKVVYEPGSGRMVKWPVLNPETSEVAIDADGNPMYKWKPEGEVKMYAVNPKCLHFPSNCTSYLDADWIQETNVRSTDYVKRKYGFSVKAEAISFYDQQKVGIQSSDLKPEERDIEGSSVIVKERWYRPCEKFANGAIIIWANDQMLVCKELNRWYPDLPYFASWNVFNDESVYADCPAYYLIPHQNELNRTESNIARHVNLVGKPKMLMNRDAGISDNAFTNETGEIVEWSGSVAPTWLLAPPVSNSLYENVNRSVERMMTIGYANDIMRTDKSRSGNAIAYEQEIDENTMAPMVASFTDMIERGLAMALQLMARYYRIPRLVKMLDSNAWLIEKDFKGDDLYGNFDVRVNFLAGLPSNKLAKQQFIMQMYEKGLLDKPLAQKYLELGDAEDALREQALEAEVVDSTIKTMEKGHKVPPHEWDNHALMILSLEKWLKENSFESDPDISKEFEQKLAWHREMLSVLTHPANKQDNGGVGMGVPRGTQEGQGGPGLTLPNEPEELGGAPSNQEPGQQPFQEQVLQSGPEGV